MCDRFRADQSLSTRHLRADPGSASVQIPDGHRTTGRASDHISATISRLTRLQVSAGIANTFTRSVREPIAIAAIVLLILFQILVLGAELTPLLVSVLLFHRGLIAMLAIQADWQTMMESAGSIEIVDAEFTHLKANEARHGANDIGPLDADLVFDNVSFSYGPDEAFGLKDINLSIPFKGSIAIVGKSGSVNPRSSI